MKATRYTKIIFGVVGVALLVGAYFLYQNTADFVDGAISADGKVVRLEARSDSDGSSTYAPVVVFTASNGRRYEFTSDSSSSPPAYTPGEAVEVLYLEDSPVQAKINGFLSLWMASAIVAFLGVVFFGISAGITLAALWKKRRHDDLRQTGMRIQSDFQNADVVESVKVNGRNPYRIFSQWQNPQTSKIHVFESDNIWFDPLDYIKTETIDVWIDRDDPDNYYMDISFLPELAD